MRFPIVNLGQMSPKDWTWPLKPPPEPEDVVVVAPPRKPPPPPPPTEIMEDGDFFAMKEEEGSLDAINDLCAKARKLRDKTISTEEYYQIRTDFHKKINGFRDSVKKDIWDMLNKYCPDQKPVFTTLREENDAITKYMKTGNMDDLFPGVPTPGAKPKPPEPVPTPAVPPKPPAPPTPVATPLTMTRKSVPVANLPEPQEYEGAGWPTATGFAPQTPRYTDVATPSTPQYSTDLQRQIESYSQKLKEFSERPPTPSIYQPTPSEVQAEALRRHQEWMQKAGIPAEQPVATPSANQYDLTPRATSQSDQYNLTPQNMRPDVATGQGGCPPGQFPAYPGGPCRGSVAPGAAGLLNQAMNLGPSGATMAPGGGMAPGYSSGGAPAAYTMGRRYPVVNL